MSNKVFILLVVMGAAFAGAAGWVLVYRLPEETLKAWVGPIVAMVLLALALGLGLWFERKEKRKR